MAESLAPIERADEIAARLIQIYEIHEVIISETGGMPGLREVSLLHANGRAHSQPLTTKNFTRPLLTKLRLSFTR